MTTLLQLEETRETELFSYISASRLNLWAKCPLAFRFRYVEEIRAPTNANLFLGKAVHGALEAYYRNRQIFAKPPTAEDAATFATLTWAAVSEEEPMSWESTADADKCRLQAVDLVRAYIGELRSTFGRRLWAALPGVHPRQVGRERARTGNNQSLVRRIPVGCLFFPNPPQK